jgi:ribosomal protein L18E
MSVIEIQREIQNLSDQDLNKVTAALVSERRKREGVDLDRIAERADREDWDEVKGDLLNDSEAE